MPGEEGAQWCFHCVQRGWKGTGSLAVLAGEAQRHQDGTHQGHPRRLGWMVERSSNHLPRQIKGKCGGLPLMF